MKINTVVQTKLGVYTRYFPLSDNSFLECQPDGLANKEEKKESLLKIESVRSMKKQTNSSR